LLRGLPDLAGLEEKLRSDAFRRAALLLSLEFGGGFSGILLDRTANQGKTRCSSPLLLQKHPARQHAGRPQRNRADFQLRLLSVFAGLKVESF
jgi:hypothetical protein